jgi:NADPH2:quinone reductase
MELLAQGKAKPLIGATFDLADTAAALRQMADGGAVGKILLQVAGAGA